jgi:hypothetical protein
MYLNYICMYVTVESALKYLSGVKNAHSLLGFSGILGNSDLLRLTVRGLRRQYPVRAAFHKEPITVMLLAAFLPLLNLALHFDRLFWAASTSAVYGFWRGSEFMTSPDVCKTHTLLKSDHTWQEEDFSHSTVTLRYTKTQWWMSDVTTHAWDNGSTTSPTRAFRAYEVGSPQGAKRAPWLFANSDGTPLRKPQMLNKTRDLALALGLDPRKFIASSWRCGAATSAAHAGLPDRLIRALGRWESIAFNRYTYSTTSELRRAGVALGSIASSSHVLGKALLPPRGGA